MKTNVNITRKLNDFDVVQRTKDSMFNATLLIQQWNDSKKESKEITKFFENKQTKEFINVLVNEENLNTQDSAYLKTRGKNGGTWMHPYLFVKFAMWLNPKFEYHVIKFVYDQLIEDRKLAGDYYNKLCSSLARFQDTDFREVGKILNLVVFNEHKSERRNSATPEQQSDLQQLTRDLNNYIELGFINSYKQFKQIARKEWAKRHSKFPDLLSA